MVAVAALVLVGVLVVVVAFRHPLTGPQILSLAAAAFIFRAGGVWLGRYILGHTGGPLQLPAYALVMLGWPEITIPGMLGWTANREHALIMATGLLAGTSVLLGLVVYVRRSRSAPG